MSVTQEQIEKLSEKLSKIKTDNPKIGEDVNEILKYIELLNEVDTSGVTPTVSVIKKENTLREDVEIKKEITKDELLACSNAKVIGGQIAVSSIMK